MLQVKVLIERRESAFPPADLVIREYTQMRWVRLGQIRPHCPSLVDSRPCMVRQRGRAWEALTLEWIAD